MKKSLLTLFVVVLIGLLAWWNWPQPSPARENWLTGNIEMTTVDIAFPSGGRLVELLPQEGDRVAPGDLLGRLDADQARALRDQVTSKIQAIRARVLESEALIEFQQASYRSQLAQVKAQREQALATLSELQNGSRKEEIALAEARFREAGVALQLAEQDRQRFDDLYQTGDVSQQQQQKAESAATQATARVQQAQEQLLLLREGPREERIQVARAAVDAAEASLDQVSARLHEITKSQRLRDSLKAEESGAAAEMERLSASLEDLTAYSPIEGRVLTRNGEPGEVVPAGRTVLRIAETARPWIRAFVSESEIGRIELGGAAQVRTDSFPGKIYSGTIAFISPEAEFTPKQIQTQEQRVRWVYRIKIQVENPGEELKLNMPCEARILTREGA